MRATRFLAAAALAVLLAMPAKAGEFRLLMLGEEWCDWCMLWEEEVGEIYHLTDEGSRAPLIRADIHEPLPDGMSLARRAHYTPTFVLLEDGEEVGRIEGYPGEDFFWGLLGRLLDENGVAPAQERKEGAPNAS